MNIGLLGLLTIIFAIAKLAGVIAWSWWIVLSPSLVGLGIGILFLVVVIAAALVGESKASYRRTSWRRP
jgi:hypothetical protein